MNSHVNSLIVEYLEFHGLVASVIAFKSEVRDRLGLLVTDVADIPVRDSSKQRLLVSDTLYLSLYF
jgi:hypothetical protein